MNRISSTQSSKAEQNQLVASGKAAAGAARSESELFKEFSSILDKIACCLGEGPSADLSAFAPAAPAPVNIAKATPKKSASTAQTNQQGVEVQEVAAPLDDEAEDDASAQVNTSDAESDDATEEALREEQTGADGTQESVVRCAAPEQLTVRKEARSETESEEEQAAEDQEEAEEEAFSEEQSDDRADGERRGQVVARKSADKRSETHGAESSVEAEDNTSESADNAQTAESASRTKEQSSTRSNRSSTSSNEESSTTAQNVIQDLTQLLGRVAAQVAQPSTQERPSVPGRLAIDKSVMAIGEAKAASAQHSSGAEASARQTAQRSEDAKSRPLSRLIAQTNADKVENALKEAAKSKDGKTISLRLDPPDLGSVKIDVTIRDGGLHARLVAEAGAVTTLLKERAPELQVALRKLGLNVDTVSVSVGNQEGERRSAQERDSEERTRRSDGGRNQDFGSIDTRSSNAQVIDTGAALDHWVA